MTTSHPLKQEAQLNDKTNVTPNNVMTPVGRTRPGQQLHIARENLHYSIEQVAAHLHLTSTVIKDIEHNRFDKGIPFTFVRGYLRAYARLVQLSPDTVIKAFDELGLEDQRGTFKIPLKSIKRPMRLNLRQLRWVAYILGAVIIAGAAIWWFSKPQKTDNVIQQDLLQLLRQVTPEKTTQE